jgi:hypothetical protein
MIQRMQIGIVHGPIQSLVELGNPLPLGVARDTPADPTR